ncbi:MAG: SdrD B-like domain-containing protein [Gemmobacter sp.]|nr:SdrD B-like domain-containing protein [Gemmobacter sp.]
MTPAGWLLRGLAALGPALALAQPAAAPYQDRVIEGLAPLTDENDGQNDYDRDGWPRFLRLETRLGTQAFDTSRRARLAYAIDGLIETPNHGALSVDGSIAPSPRQQTLTLRQRDLPLPGGWVGHHELGVISAPATDLAREPSRVLLPGANLRGLRGEWDHTGQGLQLLAAHGEPGRLTSQPVAGFQGLGGRRTIAGAQWRSPGARAIEPDGWSLAVQHERATDALTNSTLDHPSGRVDADASHLALRRDGPTWRSQAQLVRSRSGGMDQDSASGFWLDSEWDEGPRQHGLSVYRLQPGLSWAAQAMPSDVQGATLRSEWRTRQWSAEVSYDWLRSITGRLASGSYASASARWRIDRDNQFNAGTALRRFDGQAWNAYADWRRTNEWGNSGLRLELAGGRNAQGPLRTLSYDQDWAVPLGWTLSTSLGVGRYAASNSNSSAGGGRGEDNFWTTALALQAPLAQGVDLRGQFSTERRNNGQQRHSLNMGGQWRLNRHWSLNGNYTRSVGQTPVRRPLDPLAPIPTETTLGTSDRSFLLVLRYEVDAGSRSVPLGGKAQQGGGRIEGTVFFDSNRSGTQDASETGAPGVTVALDNRYSVRTDAQGRFSFPFVAAGPRTVSVRNETLPLPWGVVDDGQVKIDVRLRETTTLSLPVQRSN